MSWLIASEVPMAPKTRRFLLLGQLGYGLLFLLIPISVLWLNPPQLGSQWVLLGLLWFPLWLPLLGILRGKAYTFAWANFIVMIYFVHSLTNLWVSSNIAVAIALVELIASSLMFVGCTYYAKFRGQELGLKIPKLKDDPIRQQ
jgi:uncharacterized membrane protein